MVLTAVIEGHFSGLTLRASSYWTCHALASIGGRAVCVDWTEIASVIVIRVQERSRWTN